MQFLEGQAIESLVEQPSAVRKAAAVALVELALREVFDWGLVQTDPNFANYLYSTHSERIQLLDFGATREYEPLFRETLRDLLRACVNGSDQDVAVCAVAVGYTDPSDPPGYRDSVTALLRTATEPARVDGDYAFARSDLAVRMKDLVMEMRTRDRYARMPPPPVLFLHRKLGGLYLLLSRLRASVPVRELIAPLLADGVDHATARSPLTAV